jgi:lipoprotein-anchoring transpeptidase ErfK/SrfK
MSVAPKGYPLLRERSASSGGEVAGGKTGGITVNGSDAGTARLGSRLKVTVAGAALALAATGCAGGGTAAQPPPALQVTIMPGTGMHDVRPNAGVTVTAAHGRLLGVVVRSAKDPLSGVFSDKGTVWRSEGLLNPSHSYTVTATAVGTDGKKSVATSSFRTLRPRRTFSAQVMETYKASYGVGMPVVLTFSRPITRRAAVERALSLRTSKKVVGAWYWDGNKTVEFRPRKYWPAHTVVHFAAKFSGVEGAKGVYGVHNLHQTFDIGNSLIVVASTVSHYMKVYYKHRLFGNWPISTGRPGDDTPNGTYLTIEKGNPTLMVGPGYSLEVPWSVRFTWSGVYIHDAYWSVGEQGYTNVSHGCVNASPVHAETYYKMELPGDPVTVIGSPRPGMWDDGWTEWFLSWRHLLKGSALHQAVVAGPHGSSFVNPGTLPAIHPSSPLRAPHKNNFAAA